VNTEVGTRTSFEIAAELAKAEAVLSTITGQSATAKKNRAAATLACQSLAEELKAARAAEDAVDAANDAAAAEDAAAVATAALVANSTAANRTAKAAAFKLSPYKVTDHGATVTVSLSSDLTLYVHAVKQPDGTEAFDVNLTGNVGTHSAKIEKRGKPTRTVNAVDDTVLSEPQKTRIYAVKYAQRNTAYRAISEALTSRVAGRENVTLRSKLSAVESKNAVLEAQAQLMTAIATGQALDVDLYATVATDAAAVGMLRTMASAMQRESLIADAVAALDAMADDASADDDDDDDDN